jgi:hypothetical protein
MNTKNKAIAGILSKFKNVKETATGWQASCPAHDDNNPSLSISIKDQKILLHCFADCETADVLAAAGLEWADLRLDESQPKIVAEYNYRDESGELLYQVVRYQPKNFKVRRPDGEGGWIYNLDGTRRVPYRLDQLRDAGRVVIPEGEKDADSAVDMGFDATTNPGGAGKWRPEYNAHFRGKKVRIIPDADQPGSKHAQSVACQLFGVAKDVKVVRLPAGKDLSEWRENGGTREQFIQLMKDTPVLTAGEVEAWRISNSQRRDGFRLTQLRDLLNEPEEEVSWTADGLLPAGGVSLLVAKPKTGKSTLSRGCAMAVARGKKFLGRLTVRGKVVYLALEEKRAEVRKHFADLGANGTEEIFIHCATAPQDAVGELLGLVKRVRPALVIIDPILRLTRLKDANDYAQVNLAMEPFIAMAREFDTHLMLVYHLGKSARADAADQILGSTAFFAAVDTVLIMNRSERYRTIQSRQRYGEDMPETVLEFDAERRRITLGATKAEADITRVEDEILTVLKKCKSEMEEKEIDAAIEGRTEVKRSALRSLLKKGRVQRTGAGHKGDAYRYSVS